MSERAAPFYCPYCGEEDIRPFGELDDPHGQWRCGACRRAFRLRMIGLTRSGSDDMSDGTGAPLPERVDQGASVTDRPASVTEAP